MVLRKLQYLLFMVEIFVTTFEASARLMARVVVLPFLLLVCLCLLFGSIHDWGTKKECLTKKWTTKDNFGFLFILHYYNCNELLYASR